MSKLTWRSWMVQGNISRKLVIGHVVIFGIVLPSLCFLLDLRHSFYSALFHAAFVGQSTAADEIALKQLTLENDARLIETRDILRDYSFENGPLHMRGLSILNDAISGRHDTRLKVAVTIIASPRGSYRVGKTAEYRPQYLSQNVARFLKLTSNAAKDKTMVNYKIVVCDVGVQKGEEALELASTLKDIVTFIHYQGSVHSRLPPDPEASQLNERLYRFYKEKRDYSFCINETVEKTNADYILLVEDDAIPKDNILSMTSFLIENYLENSKLSTHTDAKPNEICYFKLYHPKRLSGYISLEVERIAELLSTGAVLGSLLCFLYLFLLQRASPNSPIKNAVFTWTICCLYVTITILLIGRQHLQSWRQMSPQLHSITPDAFCCTQGLLFPKESALRMSEYIFIQRADSTYRKDDLVFKFQQQYKPGYLVQPNMFDHVGVMSSLRKGVVDPHLMLE